jgi:putative tryptophan/tyrosine transport system substrate-binding protein
MKRREFMSLLGGAAAAWPLAAVAQQPGMPVIGFLNAASPEMFAHLAAAFRKGLNEAGYVEGQNVAIEYRWAEGNLDRLPSLANDLIRRRVTVIAAAGGAQFAATSATTTVPIVCVTGSDPVKLGLVASLNRPGGNITGMTVFSADLEAKRLELLHELVPKALVMGVLLDPRFPMADVQTREVQNAGRTLSLQVRIAHASTEAEIEGAFTELVKNGVRALLLAGGPFFNNNRARLMALTAHHRLPAIAGEREFTEAGGLMSYGTNVPDVYRQMGVYSGRILKGERPADLPFLQPSKFDFALNLRTAKTLGLDIPPTLLARADEVIE